MATLPEIRLLASPQDRAEQAQAFIRRGSTAIADATIVRNRAIVALHELGMTQARIGALLGMTQAQVSRILAAEIA
jgi:DNA-directed RNA polymerase specialized sigma subunit